MVQHMIGMLPGVFPLGQAISTHALGMRVVAVLPASLLRSIYPPPPPPLKYCKQVECQFWYLTDTLGLLCGDAPSYLGVSPSSRCAHSLDLSTITNY